MSYADEGEIEDWTQRAACLGQWHLFLPQTISPDHITLQGGIKRKAQVLLAKDTCRTCVVKTQCLMSVALYRPQHGVWAGYDMDKKHDRKKAIDAANRAVKVHEGGKVTRALAGDRWT